MNKFQLLMTQIHLREIWDKNNQKISFKDSDEWEILKIQKQFYYPVQVTSALNCLQKLRSKNMQYFMSFNHQHNYKVSLQQKAQQNTKTKIVQTIKCQNKCQNILQRKVTHLIKIQKFIEQLQTQVQEVCINQWVLAKQSQMEDINIKLIKSTLSQFGFCKQKKCDMRIIQGILKLGKDITILDCQQLGNNVFKQDQDEYKLKQKANSLLNKLDEENLLIFCHPKSTIIRQFQKKIVKQSKQMTKE